MCPTPTVSHSVYAPHHESLNSISHSLCVPLRVYVPFRVCVSLRVYVPLHAVCVLLCLYVPLCMCVLLRLCFTPCVSHSMCVSHFARSTPLPYSYCILLRVPLTVRVPLLISLHVHPNLCVPLRMYPTPCIRLRVFLSVLRVFRVSHSVCPPPCVPFNVCPSIRAPPCVPLRVRPTMCLTPYGSHFLYFSLLYPTPFVFHSYISLFVYPIFISHSVCTPLRISPTPYSERYAQQPICPAAGGCIPPCVCPISFLYRTCALSTMIFPTERKGTE